MKRREDRLWMFCRIISVKDMLIPLKETRLISQLKYHSCWYNLPYVVSTFPSNSRFTSISYLKKINKNELTFSSLSISTIWHLHFYSLLTRSPWHLMQGAYIPSGSCVNMRARRLWCASSFHSTLPWIKINLELLPSSFSLSETWLLSSSGEHQLWLTGVQTA